MEISKITHKSSLIFSFIVVVISLAVYLVVILPQQKYYYAHHVKINGIYLIKPIEIKNFELTDNHGNSFTKDNLKNHWTLLFFGFTRCGMVCPITMSVLNQMYQSLHNTLSVHDLPVVVFISVDPENDTMEKLNQYVGSFNSHFIGARTTIEKTIELEKQFHIIATKIPANYSRTDQFTMNHSPEILLINPNAQIQAYFSYPSQPEQMIKDYNSILNKAYQ